jgi:hypothetical protein
MAVTVRVQRGHAQFFLTADYRNRFPFAKLLVNTLRAVDPHKWLYAPLEAGCALVRDRNALRDAFAHACADVLAAGGGGLRRWDGATDGAAREAFAALICPSENVGCGFWRGLSCSFWNDRWASSEP